MILYSSSPSRPLVSRVTNFPCSDFFGMTYSDIGANSSKASEDDIDDEEEERESDLDREGERVSALALALGRKRDFDSGLA